jgi:hypothetical protein
MPDNQYNYGICFLINLQSEIGNTQIQVVSQETKPAEWSEDDKHLGFNKAFAYLKKMVDNDSPISVFRENTMFFESEKKTAGELLSEFTIEIPVASKIYKILSADLSQITEAKKCFSDCASKLRSMLDWGPSWINDNYYTIKKIIDYLSAVNDSSVVTGKNTDSLRIISNAVTELKRRKIMQNNNYQVTLESAKKEIFSLDFPKYFKSNLPNTEIKQVLKEIH